MSYISLIKLTLVIKENNKTQQYRRKFLIFIKLIHHNYLFLFKNDASELLIYLLLLSKEV